MAIPGYIDYQRREFCKSVRCQLQIDLDQQAPGSNEYEKVRKSCESGCRYTAYQFHHWLINNGYQIVRTEL